MHGNPYKDWVRDRPAGAFLRYMVSQEIQVQEFRVDQYYGGYIDIQYAPYERRVLEVNEIHLALSSINGTGKYDPKDKLVALKDEYGMQAGATLAKRVAVFFFFFKASLEDFKEFHR